MMLFRVDVFTYRRTNRGMTLIELMISVAIMAVIASGAFKVYANLQSAHERIDAKTEQLDRLQRFWQLFRQDTMYAVYRPIRNAEASFGPDGDPLFDASSESIAGQANLMQWSRSAGLPNMMLKTPQSELRRVSYGFDNQKLYRFQWRQMDSAPQTQPQSALLLDNISQFVLRFGYLKVPAQSEQQEGIQIDQTAQKNWQWSTQWPIQTEEMNFGQLDQSNSDTQKPLNMVLMPSVIEITIALEGFAAMTRVFEFGAPDAHSWQYLKDMRVQQGAPSDESDDQNQEASNETS